jgi:hypothetical protein
MSGRIQRFDREDGVPVVLDRGYLLTPLQMVVLLTAIRAIAAGKEEANA